MKESIEETIDLTDDRLFWFCQVDIEVLRDPELSPTDKAVYAILCSFASVADRSGRPSIGTIAEATNCSKNTARTAIKNLVSRGVLVREERYCEGRQTSCLYKIIGVNAYRGSKSEGGRVQILKGEGSKSGKAELEPKELELKDTLSEGAETAPDGQDTLLSEEESIRKIPAAMKETVEYFLFKTGRVGLLPEELGPIMALEKIHVPARIQREITIATDRFIKQGKPLTALTFGYIYDSLKYQKSSKMARAQPKPEESVSTENIAWMAWEEQNKAALMAEFGIREGGKRDADG